MPGANPTRARVVIVGGGFAGAYCAQALERKLRPEEAEITLIDRQNYFIFYPLLIEAGTGNVEPRHAVISIRSFLKRAIFRMGEVTTLDEKARQVVCVSADGRPEAISYDHLVIALGSVTKLPNIPGLREHAFEIKSLPDAVGLRDHAIHLLELANTTQDEKARAAALHFVVVGANFTGTEVAGELEAVLRDAARAYQNLRPSDIRVTLIDHGARILPALDERLSEYAARNLRKRGVDIRLKESVSEIGDDFVTLTSGEVLGARTTIWAAGIAPPPIVEHMGLPVDSRGYIVCERDLRVRGRENVWGIGDCAVKTDAQGQAYPATAQHAVREGAIAADNIARVLHNQPTRPCDIRSRGSLAALGCRTGVAHVFGMDLSGFPAWWLWRTVYLLKMPGFARKLRVALDWTLQLFFARDFVQLGVHGADRPGADRELAVDVESPLRAARGSLGAPAGAPAAARR
jgi:NADH:ubiquinone reductase (H+-translocating)